MGRCPYLRGQAAEARNKYGRLVRPFLHHCPSQWSLKFSTLAGQLFTEQHIQQTSSSRACSMGEGPSPYICFTVHTGYEKC
jgi:hypothetical protein